MVQDHNESFLRFKIRTLKSPSYLAIKRSLQWFQECGDKRKKKLGTEGNRQRIDLGIVDSDKNRYHVILVFVDRIALHVELSGRLQFNRLLFRVKFVTNSKCLH